MSSHDHNEHEDEVKGSPTYDPKYGRGTMVGIGIFVILFALGLYYVDMNYVHTRDKWEKQQVEQKSEAHGGAAAEHGK